MRQTKEAQLFKSLKIPWKLFNKCPHLSRIRVSLQARAEMQERTHWRQIILKINNKFKRKISCLLMTQILILEILVSTRRCKHYKPYRLLKLVQNMSKLKIVKTNPAHRLLSVVSINNRSIKFKKMSQLTWRGMNKNNLNNLIKWGYLLRPSSQAPLIFCPWLMKHLIRLRGVAVFLCAILREIRLKMWRKKRRKQ